MNSVGVRTRSGNYARTFALAFLIAAPVAAQPLQPNLIVTGEPSELAANVDGAAILPSTSTTGLLGRFVRRPGGSVNFSPGQTGNGMYFLACCDNTSNAYYNFSGPKLGELFQSPAGRVTFFLKSRYAFTSRPGQPRFAFHVRDANVGNNLYYLYTQSSSGRLLIGYATGSGAQFYYLPAGTENATFGNGAIMRVGLEWTPTSSSLSINNVVVHTSGRTTPNPSWTAAANFNIGSLDSSGSGFNACDDIIDEFTVWGNPPVPDTTPPTLVLTSPANASVVNNTVVLSANATDNMGMAGVQFQLDGVNLGGIVTGLGPTYSYSWDTTTASNTAHTITAIARDAVGNTTSTSISVTVANQLAPGSRVFPASATSVYASPGATVVGQQPMGALGTIAAGPVSVSGSPWWQITFDASPSGWVPETALRPLRTINLATNRWVTFQPTYTGMPNGGLLWPQGWGNKATYDPRTHRVLFSDRWLDSLRGGSIFANGIYAYHPYSNVFEIQKLNNWWVQQFPNGSYQTTPLAANTTDPTPPDHHPLTAVEFVPDQNAVYTVNGVNSISLPDLTILDATWKLDLQTKTWTKLSTPALDPQHPPNIGASPSGLIWDPVSRRLVHFVPAACGCIGATTYLFDPVTNDWTVLPRDPSADPVWIAGAGVAYDPVRNRILALGGNNYVSNVPNAGSTRLWAYSVSQNRWTQLAQAPTSIMAPGFAYDSKHDVFLALVANVTYVYNPVTNSWADYGTTISRPANLQNYQPVEYNPAYDMFIFQGGSFAGPLFAMFRYDPGTTPGSDTTPPSVAITNPANGAVVSGTVTLSANATDTNGVTGVQYLLNGANLGALVPGPGPTYSSSWNTATVADGTYTIGARAADPSGNNATATITVTVRNTVSPPVISAVAAGSITSTSARITWTTDRPTTSQVVYGLTTGYGSTTPLDSTLVTSHVVNLTGLAANTAYNFQVLSRDSGGSLAASANATFTTAPPPATGGALLRIAGEPGEVSGMANGSIVTPVVAPPGFQGTVSVKGSGSINFAPAQTGQGVYFLNCCDNTSPAYYKFTGAAIGNIFNVNQGQVTFFLKSRKSFAQRTAAGPSARFVFDVRDGNTSNHLMYFFYQVVSGRLQLTYAVNGASQFYYVPAGMEDSVFGADVAMKITMDWNGTTVRLFLNDAQVHAAGYSKPVPNWTAASNFNLGAYEYLNGGGFNVLDDIVDEFVVSGPALAADTTPPVVSITAPSSGATVSGIVNVSANATDNVGISGGVQFLLNGNGLGGVVTGAGPAYSQTWNTTTMANGSYTLTARAADAAGNVTTSPGVTVTVNNSAATLPVLTGVAAGSLTFDGATITWTTNTPASSQVAYGLTSSYGSLSPLSSALVTSHSVRLNGLQASTTYNFQAMSRDAQGNLGVSANITFTTPANSTGTSARLRIAGEPGEVSGTANGSIVTPVVAPAGFQGTVSVRGSGSVNFAPGQTGQGVYFLNCCDNTSPAYYKFTGAGIGTIFDANQGKVTFFLKSRKSFAQRIAAGASSRFVFDVRDNNPNNHLMFFRYQAVSGRLMLAYAVNGVAQFYYLPAGMEDTMFGANVAMKVTIDWNGTTTRLLLNDVQVHSAGYAKPAPNWTAASNFALGAFEYLSSGGFFATDDIIDEFTVTP